ESRTAYPRLRCSATNDAHTARRGGAYRHNPNALVGILKSTQTDKMKGLPANGFRWLRGVNMFRKISAFLVATLFMAMSLSGSSIANARTSETKESVRNPINIAILIQDDLISRVGNELRVTKEFIRSLPEGSRVMVGYITTGTLQVRQPFTTDLNRAANSLRIPIASTSASPFNPYVEVIDAMKKFDSSWRGQKVVLLISDGLDTSRGFDATTAGHTLDIDRTISEANRRDISIYSFYAPSVGLTSFSH